MSFSIDTNVALRLLVRDIEEQYLAARELVEESSKAVGVADIVFIELEYALSNHYGFKRFQIVEILSSFISHPKVSANAELFTRVFEIYPNHPALSFTDICLSVYANISGKKPLYTFDKKLASQLDDVILLGKK